MAVSAFFRDSDSARRVALASGLEGEMAEWLASGFRAGAVTVEPFGSELLAGFCALAGPSAIKAAQLSTKRKCRNLEFMVAYNVGC
jgi:hypothetical protein